MAAEPLADRAEQAVALLGALPERGRVLVVADADIDGVAAATILSRALLRTGHRFHVRLTRRRDPAFYGELFRTAPDLVITADFGSTDVEHFQKARVPTIILDHHHPSTDGTSPTLVHVNPHLVGEDGSRTASGAAVAHVFAEQMLAAGGRSADDLLPFALLGLHGDRYHGGDTGGGLQGRLVARAEALGANEDRGPVRFQPGPLIPDGPVAEALTQSLDPFVTVFHTDPDGARAALEDAGVPPDRPAAVFDVDTRRRLASWLTMQLIKQGAAPPLVEALLRPRTVVPGVDGLDLLTLGALVDAACRMDQPTKALVGLLGTGAERDPLHAAVAEYENTIRDALRSAARRRRLPPLGPAGLVRIDAGMYAGPVADRIMAWLPHGNDPVIVIGTMGRGTKVSLRARGANNDPKWRLDEIAQQAARASEGVGGGHALAAGAIIRTEHEAAFLERVKKALEARTGASAGSGSSEDSP